ncbi:MAG: DUF58 domain-containing protein [Kineosporiaceae bacterium]
MAITGRAVLLVLLGIVPAALTPGWSGAAVALGVVAVLLALDLALAGSPRALDVQRRDVPGLRLGGETLAVTDVTNGGRRRVRGRLVDGWQPSAGAVPARHRLDLAPGSRTAVTTVLRPDRRGDRLALHVTVRCLGPLGLAARQGTRRAPGSVRVLPPFTSRKHLPSALARLREIEGQTALRIRGQGTEFDSLREYVIGDDVRAIDWRASARGRGVAVRTWRPERDRRVLLVLDTSRTSAARIGDAPRLDAAMDAALLLAALAARAGDRVELLAVDQEVRARVERTDGSRLLPALVEAMAPLDATLLEADWTLIAASIRQRVPHRALVVLLTTLDPTAMDEGLLPVLGVLTERHQVLVASVADPALTELTRGRDDAFAVHAAASAERAVMDGAAVRAELVRAGVEVVEASPEGLPPALVDRYLALKAAGRL